MLAESWKPLVTGHKHRIRRLTYNVLYQFYPVLKYESKNALAKNCHFFRSIMRTAIANLTNRFHVAERLFSNCWFSPDVTKFQTSELLILLRFYFHDVLEQLKTNIQTNIHSEWVSWFSDRLRLNFWAFAWRGLYMTGERAVMLV